MILEQKFLESDLAEVEQVFLKSVRAQSLLPNKVNHYCNVLAYTFIVILFGCSLAVTILTGEISKETVLYASMGGLGRWFRDA